ncbi:hypothetical protein HF325_003598 [Metschnikowia pulcherrima]|uniref:Uncharacterized protein n=1 Tax=Metschnikowia pulcherrima TaxID=27326 RepID=A0A8H7GVT2_9ASCO|nr:hypothetical protein HF325_003598 [Metschnikowia pulcherrima]
MVSAHFDYECAYVVVPLESALWLGLGLRAGGRLFQREVGSSNEEWLEIATWDIGLASGQLKFV